jgi:ABC-type multidrug transport system fused ATPase/permease subunit
LKNEAQIDGSRQSPQQIEEIKFDIKEVEIAGQPLIQDVKMSFNKGDVIGIVGESGKGKSTLAKLIAKFRDCDGIYINQIPIAEIANEDYLKLVSYYSQNTPIITDTLLGNLNFGREPLQETAYEKLDFLGKFKNLGDLILE